MKKEENVKELTNEEKMIKKFAFFRKFFEFGEAILVAMLIVIVVLTILMMIPR